MANNPAIWFEIYVADLERARKFYSAVFQCELKDMQTPPGMNMKMSAFSGDPYQAGATGALIQMEGVQPGGNSTIVYFWCDDCAVEAARVAAAGGSVMKPKFSIGEHGFIALFTDTEGNVVGLHSMK